MPKFAIDLNEVSQVTKQIFQSAAAIRRDPESTVKEKMLALMIFRLGHVVNSLIADIHFGVFSEIPEEPPFNEE